MLLDFQPGDTVATTPQLNLPAAPITSREQIGAAFEIDNLAVSGSTFFEYQREIDAERARSADPEFNPLEHLRPGEEMFPDPFLPARSLQEMELIRQQVAREDEWRQLLGEGPVNPFLASMLAVVADPTTYIPLAGQLAKGRSLLRLAGAAATEAAVTEAALQGTQVNRPIDESVAAILMGGAFGFGLGGAGALFRGVDDAMYRGATRDFTAMMRGSDEPLVPAQRPVGEGGSVGAMMVARPAPEDTVLAGSLHVGETLARLNKVGLAAPSLELMASRFPVVRDTVLRLVDTGLATKGQMRGMATGYFPVDLRIRGRSNRIMGSTTVNLKQSYRTYKDAARARGEDVLSRDDFFQAVGRAMRRGDESPIPEAGQTAKWLREKVFDPLKKEAEDLGELPPDVSVDTALSYLTRVYQRDKIRARRPEFKRIVERWLRKSVSIDELADDLEYGEIAEDLIDRILGHPSHRIPHLKVAAKRGPMKERTFNIPDEWIEEYLESNVLDIAARYTRTMVADLEMNHEFGKSNPETELLQTIQREARQAIEAAPDEATRIRLQKEADRQQRVVQTLVERVRGVESRPGDPAYDGFVRAAKTVRNFQFLRLLGMVALSSIPDVGRVIMEEGLARTMGAVVDNVGSGFKALKMSMREAQEAGTAWDITLATRARHMMDLSERYADESKLERALDRGGTVFGTVTLLNPWNTMLKSATSNLASTRILKTVDRLAKGQKVSDRDMRKLAQGGITPDMAERIAAQSEKWERIGGSVIAAADTWDDPMAVEAFRRALMRDVDNTIITPGAGDAPLWTSTEWGKTVFQFKRFAAASVQRILLSGLQARDMAALNGLMVMVGLGMTATALRDLSAGGEVKDRTWRQWLNEGIDRSGAVSMFYEADTVFSKFSGYGAQQALTGEEASRFASRDLLGQVLGPSAGFLKDVQGVTFGAVEGDFTTSDLHKIMRMAPGSNLVGLGWLLKEFEAGLAQRLGIPEPSN